MRCITYLMDVLRYETDVELSTRTARKAVHAVIDAWKAALARGEAVAAPGMKIEPRKVRSTGKTAMRLTGNGVLKRGKLRVTRDPTEVNKINKYAIAIRSTPTIRFDD